MSKIQDSPTSSNGGVDRPDSPVYRQFIVEFLKCTVCLDFASSPITTCPNSHVLCGVCAPRLKSCPSCKSKKLSVNHLAHKLAGEAKIQRMCPHVGCTQMVQTTELNKHKAAECYFRDIVCHFSETLPVGDDCDGDTFSMIGMIEHLQSVHRLDVIPVADPNRIISDQLLHPNENTYSGVWPSKLIKWDNQVFLWDVRAEYGSVYTVLKVFAGPDVAEKYTFRVIFFDSASTSLSTPPQKKFKSNCRWELPVHPYHDPKISSDEEGHWDYDGLMKLISMKTVVDWSNKLKEPVGSNTHQFHIVASQCKIITM